MFIGEYTTSVAYETTKVKTYFHRWDNAPLEFDIGKFIRVTKTRRRRLAIVKTSVYSSDTVQIWMNLSSRGQFIAATQFSLRLAHLRNDAVLETPQFFDPFWIDHLDFFNNMQKEKYEANGIARPGLR